MSTRMYLAPVIALGAALAGCGDTSKQATARVRPGDTGVTRTSAAPAAAGPIAKVTATDAGSVVDASDYKLTDDNFARFVRASERIAQISRGDSAVAQLMHQDFTNATVIERDAGLRRLQDLPQVRQAITDAGLSVRDYFVTSIAIASARRFMDDPRAAPPTPTLTDNAQFLRAHRSELARLDELGRPAGGRRTRR